MFVTNWISTTKIQKISEITNFFRHYFLSRTEVNYQAIDVSKTADIPFDYTGLMGVPITFLDKYCPNQFEIIGHSLELADMNIIKKELGKLNGGPRFYVREHGQLCRKFERIIIRNKHPQIL